MKKIHFYTWTIAFGMAFATPANGASLSFLPTGFQLDSDAIQDLAVKVGDRIDLSFSLNTDGLNANLQSIDIRVDQDLGESSLNADRTDADEAAFPTFSFGGSPQNTGLFSAIFERRGNPGLAPNTTIELVTGSLDILSGLRNDGIPDLAVSVVSAIDANGNDVINLFNSSGQSVDLQQPIPESTPILSLLTVGLLAVGSRVKK